MEQVLLSDVLSRSAAFIVGAFIVGATALSLMRTVVIPRALRSIISDAVAKTVVVTTIGLSRLRRSYRSRDTVLAWTGPTIIILQLLTWLVLFMVGYGFLIYGVSGLDLGASIRQAGSSLLTLGFAAVDTENQTLIDFLAAATGPIVIALLIGFLPTIYSSYIQREEDVTRLSATGGEPAWGPELLSRLALAGAVDALPSIFVEWAQWSTRLRLTHVTYPVLVWVRSVRSTRHYVVSLIAMMDAAALRLAVTTQPPHKEAFSLLLEGGQALEVLYVFLFEKRRWKHRLGFSGRFTGEPDRLQHAIRQLPDWNRRFLALQVASDMDAVQGLDASAVDALVAGEKQPLQLTRADFDQALDLLRRSGFPVDRDPDEAWEQFRVARARYEFAAHEICLRLDAPPAPWTGPRRIPTATMWPTLAVNVLPDINRDGDPT